jgi:hypothetical protein
MKRLHVISVAYERVIPLRILCDCFVIQSNPNWILQIVYDGESPDTVLSIINEYEHEPRIQFIETETRNEFWGHPNRRTYLNRVNPSKDTYVLLTNDDNYYIPLFVEYMLDECRDNVGMVMCDTVHSHFHYNLHQSHPHEGGIDMGAFIVRADVATTVGFIHDTRGADGLYAEECANYCHSADLEIAHVNKPLFIHN